MFSEAEKQQFNKESDQPELEPWDHQNILDFFSLLLKIDKRLNPQNYEVKNND